MPIYNLTLIYYQPNNSGNIINTKDINGNNNANTNILTGNQHSEIEKELLSIISKLTFRQKIELMTTVYKIIDSGSTN